MAWNLIHVSYFEIIKITSPLIILSFMWSVFIGERSANPIENYILNIYFCACTSMAVVAIYKKQFLEGYQFNLIEIITCKSFTAVFIYFNSIGLVGVVLTYINYFSPIQGFDEFYIHAYQIVAIYFLVKYHGLIYLISTYQKISTQRIHEVFRGRFIELLIMITSNFLILGVFILIVIIAASNLLPSYIIHPLFVFLNWILPVTVGVIAAACGCVLINESKENSE